MDEETRLVIRIMHLAYLVQRFTDYCVFIEFSGHVNQLLISIRESKPDWQTKVLESEFYTEYKSWRDKDTPTLLSELRAKENILERILIEREIQFDELDYEEEYSRIYTF